MNLLHLADDKLWDKIHSQHQTKGGVYKIIAVHNSKPTAVNRFLGTDNSGTLYIGKATSFVDRVIDLKKTISPNYNGQAHICGRRYKSNPNIALKFPFDDLHIELIESDSPETLEKKHLKEYATVYGEVPPLNAI